MGMLPRMLGLLLLVAVGLPMGLLGHSRSLRLHPQRIPTPAPLETAYTVATPCDAVPFHQFRLSNAPPPLLKGLNWGNDEALAPNVRQPEAAALTGPALSIALREKRQAWQFSQRTAGSPRAPCRLQV